MPVLNTLRQEVFSRNVAEGKTFRESAILAGYSKRSATRLGSQLMQQKRIRERVLELKALSPRPVITRETVLQDLAGPGVQMRDHGSRRSGPDGWPVHSVVRHRGHTSSADKGE